jgi:gamma-glutamyl:cysteine ligase YbdK (ATP-grasp superfamily)
MSASTNSGARLIAESASTRNSGQVAVSSTRSTTYLAQSSDVVLAGLSDEPSAQTSPDTHAAMVELATGVQVPVREALQALLVDCRPHAAALGCAQALDRVRWLVAGTGADRRRAFAAGRGSLEDLVARLAGRFLAPSELAVAAGQSK